MEKSIYFLLFVSILVFQGCSSSKNLIKEVAKEQAKFEYTPPAKAPVGGANMSIVLVKPVFVSENPEYLVEPFPEMAESMSNDFEELLSAKGFTIRGPFKTRDEMVYTEKVNSSFILEIQIDLKPECSVELIEHIRTSLAVILFSSDFAHTTYSTKGNISFGGNLILTALSPQYGEKIWKKSIAFDRVGFPYVGTVEYVNSPELAAQLVMDNQVYNTVAKGLEKFYAYALDVVWKQIDPEEMKIVEKQAKEADRKSN